MQAKRFFCDPIAEDDLAKVCGNGRRSLEFVEYDNVDNIASALITLLKHRIKGRNTIQKFITHFSKQLMFAKDLDVRTLLNAFASGAVKQCFHNASVDQCLMFWRKNVMQCREKGDKAKWSPPFEPSDDVKRYVDEQLAFFRQRVIPSTPIFTPYTPATANFKGILDVWFFILSCPSERVSLNFDYFVEMARQLVFPLVNNPEMLNNMLRHKLMDQTTIQINTEATLPVLVQNEITSKIALVAFSTIKHASIMLEHPLFFTNDCYIANISFERRTQATFPFGLCINGNNLLTEATLSNVTVREAGVSVMGCRNAKLLKVSVMSAETGYFLHDLRSVYFANGKGDLSVINASNCFIAYNCGVIQNKFDISRQRVDNCAHVFYVQAACTVKVFNLMVTRCYKMGLISSTQPPIFDESVFRAFEPFIKDCGTGIKGSVMTFAEDMYTGAYRDTPLPALMSTLPVPGPYQDCMVQVLFPGGVPISNEEQLAPGSPEPEAAAFGTQDTQQAFGTQDTQQAFGTQDTQFGRNISPNVFRPTAVVDCVADPQRRSKTPHEDDPGARKRQRSVLGWFGGHHDESYGFFDDAH